MRKIVLMIVAFLVVTTQVFAEKGEDTLVEGKITYPVTMGTDDGEQTQEEQGILWGGDNFCRSNPRFAARV